MASYKIERSAVSVAGKSGDLFKVGFADPAQNDQIVKEAHSLLDDLVQGEDGGAVALINGPASLPVACVLAHALGHRYGAVGVFDPKMAAYIVSMAHGGEFEIGDLIPAADVVA